MRALEVLLGLVELYIEQGKPVGSNTLREQGFEHLSSATIRNYFVDLERRGLLHQAHTSGGRTPTSEAFRLYASEALENHHPHTKELGELEFSASKQLLPFLQLGAERLSEISGYATFLSSVRFDQDFILDIKLVGIDEKRALCVMVTDFGQIYTEVLSLPTKISSFALKRIEGYIVWRIKGGEQPANLSQMELSFAGDFYSEIMVRYLVRYSNYSDEDVFRTGFSRLLTYPEFNDPLALATGLSLFENPAHMRLLLNDCVREGSIRFWIGKDLASYGAGGDMCTVLAIPYYIGTTAAGAIGLLGPSRMPYPELFGLMKDISTHLTNSLTKTLLKFKISFRQPRSTTPYLNDQTAQNLLEIKE